MNGSHIDMERVGLAQEDSSDDGKRRVGIRMTSIAWCAETADLCLVKVRGGVARVSMTAQELERRSHAGDTSLT